MGGQAACGDDGFAATRWSLVATAGDSGVPLAELCVQYWYPLYAHARRQGLAAEPAQRVTRAFLGHLVSERLAALRSDPPPRFREWLQREWTRFIAGGGTEAGAPDAGAPLPAPAPVEELEARYLAEGRPAGDDEAGFRRSFALEVLSRGASRLCLEARQAGREQMYALMSPYLVREPAAADYEAWAHQLGLRPLVLASALKRLRQRYRELVEDELAQTVSAAAELEAERLALHEALRGHAR